MKRLLLIIGLLFPALVHAATVYTVGPSGRNYTSISACAAVARAGDTCQVYAGTYSGWTQGYSGSAGLLITFIANSGDTVNITGAIDLSSRAYVRISGFTITNSSGSGITGNGSTQHNQIDNNKFTTGGPAFRIPDGLGSGGSDNLFLNNTVTGANAGNIVGIYLFGDRNRIENNTITGTDGDCMDLGGANVVVRNNTCKNVTAATSREHIDFIQVQPTDPILTNSLIEGNVYQGCVDSTVNCHALILRSFDPYLPVSGVIYRFNYAQNLNGGGVTIGGGSGDLVTKIAVYNNTIATEYKSTDNGNGVSCWSGLATYAIIANNIIYNSEGGSYPIGCSAAGDSARIMGGDIAYNTTGGTFSWYNETGRTVNPLFANYPTDGTLQASSPAIGTGVAVATASNAGTSSTSLQTQNAYAFQPGWAGIPGDYIRIGTSTVVQVTAINYSTNTLTITPAASWSSGASIYLYKKTDGTAVLSGSSPDVGAFPYSTGTSTTQILRPNSDANSTLSSLGCAGTNVSSLAMPTAYDANTYTSADLSATATNTSTRWAGRLFSGFPAASGTCSALTLSIEASCLNSEQPTDGACKVTYSTNGGSSLLSLATVSLTGDTATYSTTLPVDTNMSNLRVGLCVSADLAGLNNPSSTTLSVNDIWAACVPSSGGTTYTVTLTPPSNGSILSDVLNCGNVCSASYPAGTQVTLTPSAASGYQFSAWTGDCTGSGTCVLTVNSNLSVGATFVSTYVLSTSSGAGGSISNCAASYVASAPYSCTITPNTGYGWTSISGCGHAIAVSDPPSTSAQIFTGTMPANDCTVTASFTAIATTRPKWYGKFRVAKPR